MRRRKFPRARPRVAIVASHPIQYQAPLYRALAQAPEMEIEALFCHDHGLRESLDKGFGIPIRYDVPLTDGYPHRFLPNISPRRGASFAGLVNPEIVRLMLDEAYDAVVFNGYSSVTNLAGILCRPLSRTRVLLRGDSNIGDPRSTLKLGLKKPALHTLLRFVDHALSIGTNNDRYWRHYGMPAERITLAPYAVDNQHFFEGAAAARQDLSDLRRRLGFPSDRAVFLFCGKLQPVKRPLDLVNALAIASRHAPCALAIVGEGELREQVVARARELGLESHVHMLGFRNQSELPRIYAACDALVLPSEREAWGLVVNEAMAAGTPAIVSDRVGSGPDLVDGVGEIFPTGNVRALAAILSRWALDSNRAARARIEARRRIESWSVAHSARGFRTGISRALENPRPHLPA